jgi:hypothetical protein
MSLVSEELMIRLRQEVIARDVSPALLGIFGAKSAAIERERPVRIPVVSDSRHSNRPRMSTRAKLITSNDAKCEMTVSITCGGYVTGVTIARTSQRRFYPQVRGDRS